MPVDALIRALDAVHTAILAGKIDGLETLTDVISDNAADLSAATAAQLGRVRSMAARNALCLQSAAKGIRAAQRRLTELRQAGSGHATYDQYGHRARLGGPHGLLRQRI